VGTKGKSSHPTIMSMAVPLAEIEQFCVVMPGLGGKVLGITDVSVELFRTIVRVSLSGLRENEATQHLHKRLIEDITDADLLGESPIDHRSRSRWYARWYVVNELVRLGVLSVCRKEALDGSERS
jgi:hypothetical protein